MRKETIPQKAQDFVEAASQDLLKAWLITINTDGETNVGFTYKGEVVMTMGGEQLDVSFTVKLTIEHAEILSKNSPKAKANKKPGASNTGPAPKTQKGRRA